MTRLDDRAEQHSVTSPELEALAELCHEQWCDWMRYMFSRGKMHKNGSWTMPDEYVKRWQRQAMTLYEDLNFTEQDSDRKEAHKFLKFFHQLIERQSSNDQ